MDQDEALAYLQRVGAQKHGHFVLTNWRHAETYASIKKIVSIIDIELTTWTETECLRTGPCGHGVRINTVIGHGRDFCRRTA